MKTICAFLTILLVIGFARAEVIGLDVEYFDGSVKLQGYLAYDQADNSIRPGVLVIHEWWGMNDYSKRRARELAELGYIAFACDMYGAGVTTNSWEEAPKLAGPFYQDRALMRSRAAAGLAQLRNHTLCSKTSIAAIGYCFGGSCALELARSGVDLKGVVSFHGALNTPNLEDAKQIKAKLLVCHGGDDQFVKMDELLAFQKEMQAAGVNYEIDIYSGAVHAFTNPAAGSDPTKGVAYNEQADRRSWKAMQEFFKEIFAK